MTTTKNDLITIHPRTSNANTPHGKRIAVCYLHGGGLLYGERDDLPTPYIDQFTGAGYELICLDYPLAPETELPVIVSEALGALESHMLPRLASGELDGYALFGRSAGAYLALLLAREIARGSALPAPVGLIDLYGYPGMLGPEFSQPCAAYTTLPTVSAEQVGRIAGPHAVTNGPKALRYALYVHARQHEGAWLRLLGLDRRDAKHSPEAWALTDEDLALLPPLFIAASTGDEDVAFRISKDLARRAPSAVMKTAYYLPHDFDRDTADPTGARIYSQAISWLNGLTKP